MALDLGSWNLLGGPPGIGIPLPFGGRFGVGEVAPGGPLSGGPPGLIGDTVKVVGRQRGFLILQRQGGGLTFIKTQRRRRFRSRASGGSLNKTLDRAMHMAMIKAMLK